MEEKQINFEEKDLIIDNEKLFIKEEFLKNTYIVIDGKVQSLEQYINSLIYKSVELQKDFLIYADVKKIITFMGDHLVELTMNRLEQTYKLKRK